jgi:hypothetical protein
MDNAMASYPLPIGYLTLADLALILDPTQPVYVAPLVESLTGTVPGQYTDYHYIMVAQPDDKNRVHYCRIAVVQLVYHNGIAFAPDYGEQLGKVGAVRAEVEERLAEEGFAVRRGMVGVLGGVGLMDGSL